MLRPFCARAGVAPRDNSRRRQRVRVDALLLDSGNQRLAVKELGGTGRTHDCRLSRKIVETVRVPGFLGGGLTPENVATAIREACRFGVGVCSGLRTNGQLDESKVRQFTAIVAPARVRLRDR